MRRIPLLLGLSGLLLAAACDGAREDAGEKADTNSGAVSSEDSIQSGPAESLGETQDEAIDSAADAKEAQADALEDRAEEAREAAEQQADRLEEQADAVLK